MTKAKKTKKTKTKTRKIPVSARSGNGQILISLRTQNIGGKRYPMGSVLDPNEIPANALQAMLNSKIARWEAHTDRNYPQATELPKAEPPPKAHPAVLIVGDIDPVESWRLTKAAMTRVLDGNAALAMDVLMGSVAARDLYKRAQFEACRREAKRRGVVSVGPSDLEVAL